MFIQTGNQLKLIQVKEKKIVHIETRKTSSGTFQLYLEIESKSSEDWNNITRSKNPTIICVALKWLKFNLR